MRPYIASLLPFVLLAAWPAAADAQVRRCTTDAGGTIYTDKPCQDVGAVERVQPGGNARAAALHRSRCHRTLQDLVFELTMAIDGRDPNRLAALYHWPGTPTRSGYALMERLDAIAQRPLVDVRPLYPVESPPASTPAAIATQDATTADIQPPSSSELMRRAAPWRPSAEASSADASPATADVAPETPLPEASTPRHRAPNAIQVDQTLANGSTPSRTVFGLRRHLGCLWISL